MQIELAATGGTAPDGQLDNVLASATNGNNTIVVSSAAGVVSASGLPTGLKIEHADATDVLTINSLSGNDTINASMLAAGVISLTLNGGDGNDTITGKRWQGLGAAGGALTVEGLSAKLSIVGSDAGVDRLVINALDGNDVVDASGVSAGQIGSRSTAAAAAMLSWAAWATTSCSAAAGWMAACSTRRSMPRTTSTPLLAIALPTTPSGWIT